MLERPELEQLAQRVIARFHLKALSSKETEHYIRHRLSVAGMTRAIPFDRKALQRIHEIARGVPRRINLLCDRAMLGAYAHGKHRHRHARSSRRRRARCSASRSRTAPTAPAWAPAPAWAWSSPPAWRWPRCSPSPSTAPGASSPRRRRPVRSGLGAACRRGGVAELRRSGERRRRRQASAARPREPRRRDLCPRDERIGPGERAATGRARHVDRRRRACRRGRGGAGRQRARRALPRWRRPRARPDPRRGRAEGAVDGARARREDGLARARGAVEGRSRQRRALRRLRPPAGALLQVRDHPGDAEEPRSSRLPRPARRGRADDERGPDRPARRHRDPAAPTAGRRRSRSPPWRKLWQGEFGTLWRTPPGYTGALAEGATGPLVDRLATQLAGLAGEPAPPPRQTLDAALRTKIVRFQTANGLSPVGKAGPTTFMQLNRATGVDEPRLAAAP